MTLWKILLPAALLMMGLFGVGRALIATSNGPYQDYWVPAESSMDPTLGEGDRISVRSDTANDLRRGDIVLIKGEDWLSPTDAPVLKRVIGVGGDRVRGAVDGSIEVNGHAIREDYLHNDPAVEASSFEFDVTVPDGTVFVAGDKRNNSLDSRIFVDEPGRGGLRPDAIVGTVVAVNGDSLAATTAFTDAGLPAAAFEEDTSLTGTRLLLLIGGIVLVVGAAVWLLVNLVRRRTSTSR